MKRLSIALLVAGLTSAPAFAADKKDDQVKRMQQAQRKLMQEKEKLGQEKAALDGQLKEAEGKLEATAQKADAISRQAASLKRNLTQLEAEKKTLATKLADTESKLAKTSEQLASTEAEKLRLEALSAKLDQNLASCASKNETLYKEGSLLLERYEKKSCFDTALQGEPFTALKRVEMENLKESAQEKFDDARYSAQTP